MTRDISQFYKLLIASYVVWNFWGEVLGKSGFGVLKGGATPVAPGKYFGTLWYFYSSKQINIQGICAQCYYYKIIL